MPLRLGTLSMVVNVDQWLKKRVHHGLVLDVSRDGFDRGAATSASVFVDEDDQDTLFMFYAGASDIGWSHSAIGLARSEDGLKFEKVSKVPILEGDANSFCCKEALAPVVTRVKNRFYMVFTGKASFGSSRRLGIAYADAPEGPWHIIGELIKPTRVWEGRDIDNGLSLVRLSQDTFLVFYSNITSWTMRDVFTFLRRYPVRRIGMLKVRVRGTSPSSIEAYRSQNIPLKHLNGPKKSWNESLFCPGYIQLSAKHCLFPAASTYSIGYPYRQYIGMVTGNSPFFSKNECRIEKLIDGPLERSSIIPGVKGEIALDTPVPVLRESQGELFLYYSVMDRADGIWKTALTIFRHD